MDTLTAIARTAGALLLIVLLFVIPYQMTLRARLRLEDCERSGVPGSHANHALATGRLLAMMAAAGFVDYVVLGVGVTKTDANSSGGVGGWVVSSRLQEFLYTRAVGVEEFLHPGRST